MSRTVNLSVFGSLKISNGLCSRPSTPAVPPPKRRSTELPSCTNGGIDVLSGTVLKASDQEIRVDGTAGLELAVGARILQNFVTLPC